jgi:hypothetical protein
VEDIVNFVEDRTRLNDLSFIDLLFLYFLPPPRRDVPLDAKSTKNIKAQKCFHALANAHPAFGPGQRTIVIMLLLLKVDAKVGFVDDIVNFVDAKAGFV